MNKDLKQNSALKNTLLIASRDFKQIISSPLFYLMSALCAIIWSITFRSFLVGMANQMMSRGMQGQGAPNIIQAVFLPHIQVVNLIFIIVLPALTMRLIAEEKKSRSYDLLMTSPITSAQIVIGKYIAGLLATSVLLMLSLLYPLAMGFIAKFSWSMLGSIYLGLFLLAALYTASGLFASSLTESAMLAVFMGVMFNFLIWFVGASAAGSEVKWFTDLMEYLSVGQQMSGFITGSLQLSAVIFFITTISFFVFLSERVVESSRWR